MLKGIVDDEKKIVYTINLNELAEKIAHVQLAILSLSNSVPMKLKHLRYIMQILSAGCKNNYRIFILAPGRCTGA